MKPSKTPLRWGILGTGWIASEWAKDVRRLKDHRVVAVGSRNLETARRFARTWKIDSAFGSYEELVRSPEVDAIYVSTPHPYHGPNTILALEAGKHVLCEKPFAMDSSEARSMIELARDKGLLLMEAMWTRFLPHVRSIRRVLEEGTLGTIVALYADHGQYFAENPTHRLYAPELGGGALLDLGIYPINFASMVLGTPSQVVAVAEKTSTGVDAQTSMVFGYASSAHAVLTTTLRARSGITASIVGTEARLDVDGMFFVPSSYTIEFRSGRRVRYKNTYSGKGLREQVAEFGRCLDRGECESPELPHSETLSILETMDEVRRQIGLDYRALTSK